VFGAASQRNGINIFIEERMNLILEALRLKLEGIEFNVFDMGNRTNN
jgi:hypothetical protein